MKTKLLVLLGVLLTSCFFSQIALAAESSGLPNRLAKETGLSIEDARNQINLVFHAVEKELQSGNQVRIRSFGKFYLQHRDARTGRNPKTGRKIEIPARKYPKFTSSDKLKQSVNQS